MAFTSDGVKVGGPLRVPGAHVTRALVSGTWVTPSLQRPAHVIVKVAAASVGAGDSADFDIEVRDLADVLLDGYPVTMRLTRGGLVAGDEEMEDAISLLVPAGFDYRIVNNSTGVTGVAMNAIEDTL